MRKLGLVLGVVVIVGVGRAQVTERVSVGPNGVQGGAGGDLPFPCGSVISTDGRFVAFMSYSQNLVVVDTNSNWDIFVHDRQSGTTELVSLDSNGGQSNGVCGVYGLSISADGRYVAFESTANNLVAGDTNGAGDLFVRDRLNGTTERVSVGTGGVQANADSLYPSISADGRYVAFASDATNLVSGDTNGVLDTFVHDRVNGTTERVSVATGGVQGNQYSGGSWISADGRFVVFPSMATNLVPGDTNGVMDTFVHDRLLGTTERVSVATGGVQGNAQSVDGSISADGRYIAFRSFATNLVPGDTNNGPDIFLRDRRNGTTELISVSTAGMHAITSGADHSMSPDGRFVTFVGFFPGALAACSCATT